MMKSGQYLFIFSLLDGFLHGLERVSCQLGGYDELLVDVLDLLHHIKLQLVEGFLQLCAALEGRRWSGSVYMRTNALSAQRFVYCV